MSSRRLFLARLTVGLSLLVTLGACVVPPAREPVDSLSTLGKDETIVVGRIELIPPLREGEQKFQGIIVGDFKDKMFLITDDKYRVLTEEPVTADYSGRIEAKLGQNFFVRSSDKTFYILGGVLYLSVGGSGMDRAFFPGGMKVSLKPGDKAVYIGTVQYHRNEFFDVTKVVVRDDYRRTNAEYKKKFGTKRSLRKALLTPVNKKLSSAGAN